MAILGVQGGAHAAGDDFLDPEQAFVLAAPTAQDKAVGLSFQITSGYYLYREHFKFEADGATLGEAALPAGQVKFDTTFQKNVETYHGPLAFRLPVQQAPGPFTLRVTYQGCAEAGLCYPPITKVFRVSLKGFGGDDTVQESVDGALAASPAVSPAEAVTPSPMASAVEAGTAATQGGANRIEALLKGGHWWAIIGGFWVMGLLLAFTPCVLPMLPILSSIIAGSGEATSRRRGFLLALAYSLGMALLYTAMGVAAGLAGEGLAAALQTPWVLLSFAGLLLVLALAMFDVYELRLPHALSNHLDGMSRRLPGGQFLGVFVMGGLSALIVSPCVTAPLAGTLVFLSQSRDVVLAGTALFAMAMGMSMPLLLLGASAGHWLPRSGAWMHAVKRFFGLVLVGVALWVAQPALPSSLALALWAGLLLVVGFMLRPFDAHPHSGTPRVWLQRAGGVAALAYGVMQLAGAASGGSDALQPLRHWSGAVASPVVAAPALDFRRVASVEELDQILRTTTRPVMLDFYADWCVACKEMERFTFSDGGVQARLGKALLLKADVTANSTQDKALLQRFQLFGPPGTIFFDAQGKESGVRAVGFEPAEEFIKTLEKAGL
ncbi:protein-disulfide reductase DsbD [Ideonella oryzae]|uniref:protein-disulfide reductase DsbD n=1 Tax=Ideonella oryzae TaxID=2937441 RepID=UPI00338E4B2E